ncbi:acyl transferase/acyl hydrolase/lysophospholipase [Coniochaeta sp. 2T2.1]|nr:acyl transferase/acyl hydrolase/lysophospholipase [Coniochaeta sp. 2T2.1]
MWHRQIDLPVPHQRHHDRHHQIRHAWFFSRRPKPVKKGLPVLPTVFVLSSLLIWSLYPADEIRRLTPDATAHLTEDGAVVDGQSGDGIPKPRAPAQGAGAWFDFTNTFSEMSVMTDIEWTGLSDKVVGYILPEWSKFIPGYIRKLQRELSMAPGSLADEIWHEARDPYMHPEIQYSARVRVSNDLCDEEKEFLSRRKKIAQVALAKYLSIPEKDVHPDDVPTIAVCGSGGGLRALVAGTGSLLATAEDGLFDCVTYTSGVSGSCWLQAMYYSTISNQDLYGVLDHLKARLGVHIAYPPVAFSSMLSAPTNKYLLAGMVEKLKGDQSAAFGLVDIYGILLGARLLVPKGELGVDAQDFKLSNQRDYIKYGQNPMPIYTAVRHEIPDIGAAAALTEGPSEEAKQIAKKEAWFQWYEITPYEMFCEEFSAGIPTWAMGRKFKDGVDVPAEHGFHLPEVRMPFLLGMFGSAFCATLSHYYREIRPLVQNLAGFGALDEMIWGRNEDLSKVHPIDPATLPNFCYGMDGKLPSTAPGSILQSEYMQLMDAGMSNNIPIYPLLRPGRDVDVVLAFDASADIKTENWLSVADGYARQRGIKGWPVGIGWPKTTDSVQKTAAELDEAQASTPREAEEKLTEAKYDQAVRRMEATQETYGEEDPTAANIKAARKDQNYNQGNESAGELGYCTVWVGTTQERSTTDTPPPSKALDDETTWQLSEPEAGITVVYCPFLTNDKVPGVDPATSPYMSTWNFVYTPEQIDGVVALARANYEESRERIRATVRAVYERKKKTRREKEKGMKKERYRRLVRLGINDKLEGDHFS